MNYLPLWWGMGDADLRPLLVVAVALIFEDEETDGIGIVVVPVVVDCAF
jgi:hypothetical protein